MDMQMPTPLAATPPPAAAPPATPETKAPKSVANRLKGEADKARQVRDELAKNEWKANVNYRRGKPFSVASEENRVAVPFDWSFTKSKEAGLFSQVPQVILTPKHDRYKAAVQPMQQELNTVLADEVKIAVAMEEGLSDLINAAGLVGIMCGYLATFEDVEVPDRDVSALDPAMVEQMKAVGAIKMLPSKKKVDCKFYANRLSPSQLLWPRPFKGSDFDDADWIGYDGTCTWAQGLMEFGKSETRPQGLTPEMEEKVCGSADQPETLNESAETPESSEGTLSYTRLFYWAARQDPNEKRLEKIRQIVYVSGIDDPIIDEDLPWQEWSESTQSFIGVTKFPLRMGTLTYISDTPVPPSDSEIGRPQVDEMMRSRSQMTLQRDRSAPMRWANVNRVDPMIMESLIKGDDYQRIIPVNGDGQQAIGEVARANYPSENWEFDRVQKQDLMDSWQVGPNQVGSFSTAGRTKGEADIVQSGFATRQAKERGKVGKIFCGIAEVIGGLMQMFHEGPKEAALIGEDGVKRIESTWDRKAVSGAKFVYTIREDSTVKLDTQQRMAQIEKYLNLTGKSGFVNVQAIIEEYTILNGLDPAKVIVQPNPPQPEPPNVSLRASGEDLQNPIAGPYIVALLQKGHPVQPADIDAAKQLLILSSTLPLPPAEPGVPGAPPTASPAALPPQTPQPPKDYGPIDRITKRVNEIGG